MINDCFSTWQTNWYNSKRSLNCEGKYEESNTHASKKTNPILDNRHGPNSQYHLLPSLLI
jgi:hypothetical protein